MTAILAKRGNSILHTALVLAAFALYRATLLPGIGTGDTAEFQWVAPTLGLAHATGYPLYTLLGWVWSHLPLGGNPAWRMNLFSAATAAAAVGGLYLAARELGQRQVVASGVALTLATSRTFWMQATKAEVYALAAAIEVLLILVLLRWRAGRLPFWTVGFVFGLGLTHHRSLVLLLPGIALFLLLSRRPSAREWSGALLALLATNLLYLYVPLRAAAWQNRWQVLFEYLSGSAAGDWLDPHRLRSEGLARPLALAHDFIWPQLLPIGAVLAILGAVRLLRRDRALAALLLTGYAVIFAFCSAYYAVDVEVFLSPAHLLAALLLGEGAMLLLSRLQPRLALPASLPLLGLAGLLFDQNLPDIRQHNQENWDPVARAIMAQPLASDALIAGDAYYLEGLRYLQAVEGRHPGFDFHFNTDPQRIRGALEAGQAVYLLRPAPELGLAQQPEGRLWRVTAKPLAVNQAPGGGVRWAEGLKLVGYTVDPGPYTPGQLVPVTLAWQAEQTPEHAYMLFVHIIDEHGNIHGQQDRAPSAGPTNQWRPGEQYIDIYGPMLKKHVPPGRYTVIIGWYEFPSPRRLPRLDSPDSEAQYAVLGQIEVMPPGQ